MKRRQFARKSALAAISATAISNLANAAQDTPSKEFYEVRIYTKSFGRSGLDEHLEKALIPALNRQGVKGVGAFTQLHADQPGELYLLITYNSLEHYGKVKVGLDSDSLFVESSMEYSQKLPDQAPVQSYQSSFLEAFDGLPKMRPTDSAKSRLFELRTYMGHNEDAVGRKTAMFNDEELPLFDKVGLHPVLFGRALMGQNLPNLTYMLVFDDMDERDKNWSTFAKHPDWAQMKVDPKYANTVSNIIRTFLVPTAYSQI